MGNMREVFLERERQNLSKYAFLTSNTRGRDYPYVPCEMRTEFQRDRDRIIHCQSFRRLMNKTQVFLAPVGDHYRTRLTHTLEVAQIARTMARAMRLNEDLTEAIALGHDLGHTPFGHAGERMLNELNPHGFHHYEQSLRVVDHLENNGEGLDLTYEVRDGILKHTNQRAETKEGQIVRYADVIAYINHDIDDSVRAGIISENDLPQNITDVLGHSKSKRITTLITSVVNGGAENIHMDERTKEAYDALHKFMFDYVYTNPKCKSEETKAQDMIAYLYQYYVLHIEALPAHYLNNAYKFGADTAVCDYIAGMTDGYAVETFKNLFIPKSWTMY